MVVDTETNIIVLLTYSSSRGSSRSRRSRVVLLVCLLLGFLVDVTAPYLSEISGSVIVSARGQPYSLCHLLHFLRRVRFEHGQLHFFGSMRALDHM